jgi:uncharacterized OB-fold protein
MFSQCLKCGYIADPQDVWCMVCTPKFSQRMVRVIEKGEK